MKKSKQEWALATILAILTFLYPYDQRRNDQQIKTIETPTGFQVLINKKRKLKSDYIPNNLLLIHETYANEGKYLVKEARDQFEKLSKDAHLLGYRIIAVSAYRTYDYQETLYQDYLKTKGQDYADQCSAKPGHSEHQTGLAIDVMGSNEDYDEFALAVEFPWLRDHAHRYGFIMRYPKGKETITGFKYEPWHYRYVGKEVAKIIYDKNWTLEEYWENLS